MNTKIDIRSENFDLYFYHELEKVPNERKEQIPKSLAQIIWGVGGQIKPKNIKHLNIFHRLYLLVKLCNKNFTVVVSDDEHGVKDMEAFNKLQKKKDFTISTGEEQFEAGRFILGGKELMSSLNYLNHVCHSPAYNYVVKLKGESIPHPGNDFNKQIKYLARVFKSWESQKKLWVNEFGLQMPEIYVLLTLYVDGELVGARIYQDIFRRAYQSGHSKIKLAFRTLQAKGMIERNGIKRGASMRITATGVDLIHKIIMKYAVNC